MTYWGGLWNLLFCFPSCERELITCDKKPKAFLSSLVKLNVYRSVFCLYFLPLQPERSNIMALGENILCYSFLFCMGRSRRNLNKSLPSSFAQQQWQMVYPNFQLICSTGQRKGVPYHLVFTVTYGDRWAYYFYKAQNSIHAPGAHSPGPPYCRFKVMLYWDVVK